jgi:hypothetical protein
MELSEQFSLAAVLGAITSAAEDENHGMRSLEFGELAAFCGVVGKLVICAPRRYVSLVTEPTFFRELAEVTICFLGFG